METGDNRGKNIVGGDLHQLTPQASTRPLPKCLLFCFCPAHSSPPYSYYPCLAIKDEVGFSFLDALLVKIRKGSFTNTVREFRCLWLCRTDCSRPIEGGCAQTSQRDMAGAGGRQTIALPEWSVFNVKAVARIGIGGLRLGCFVIYGGLLLEDERAEA